MGKPWTRSAAVVFCVIASLLGGYVWAEKPTTTITGTVKRAEIRQGKVVSVYIEDPEQGDFLVVRGTTVGKELLQYVGKTVTATGYVKKPREETEFNKVIDVLSYQTQPPAEPDPKE